jgi:hypothetical protein
VLLDVTTTSDWLPRAPKPPRSVGRQPVSASGFRWEADMTALVSEQVARLLPRSSGAHLLAGEVPAAQGVADIVAVRFNVDALRRRLASGIGPVCSPLRVRTLYLLRGDRGMRLTTLACKLGSNVRALARSTLEPLAAMGTIELSGGVARATGAWTPVGAQVTAVELKLSKWRDALRQADNFSLSADHSWVVVDQTRAKAAVAACKDFEALGVGLAALDLDGSLHIVVAPRRRRPEPWLRALMAERAWSVAEAEVAAVLA